MNLECDELYQTAHLKIGFNSCRLLQKIHVDEHEKIHEKLQKIHPSFMP